MSDINQTREELLHHLEEQLGFLRLSAESFDEGYLGEAKRMALVIRILVHDTGRSTSLLNQLEMKDIDFLNTASKYNPNNLIAQTLLLSIRISSDSGSQFIANLDNEEKKEWIKFDDWWETIVLSDKYGQTLTRKELILSVADQDGGAHIDPKINEKYGNITRLNTLDVYQNKDGEKQGPLKKSHLISVRQIAHEVLITLDKDYEKSGPSPKNIPEELKNDNESSSGGQFSVTFEGPRIKNGRVIQEPFKSDKIGRNEPCPCGSGKKYKYCHGK